MELFIGIDKNKELVSLEWDKEDNRQRKTFSLCGSSYNSPTTEEEGENTNGEFQQFGEIEGEDIYLNCGSGGQHQVKIEDFEKLFVSEQDIKKVYEIWDNQHLKPLRDEDFKFMEEFFEKYKNLCDRQEALNKSYELMKA